MSDDARGLPEENPSVFGIDHVQLAMPAGQEAAARRFYGELIGLVEIAKPPHLGGRGGGWFEQGSVKVHLGVDAEFRPARKAHVDLLVSDLAALTETLRTGGHEVLDGEPVAGYRHVYVSDPFGNRLELLERESGVA